MLFWKEQQKLIAPSHRLVYPEATIKLVYIWTSSKGQVKVLLTNCLASKGSPVHCLSRAISKVALFGPLCCCAVTVLSYFYFLFILFIFIFFYAEADAKINVKKKHDISFLLYACDCYYACPWGSSATTWYCLHILAFPSMKALESGSNRATL